MANKIEILVEVDPTGQGSARLKSLQTNVAGVGQAAGQSAQAGSLLGSVFAGNALYDYFRRGTAAAKEFVEESIKAYGELAADERFLASQVRDTGGNFAVAKQRVDEFDEKLALSRTNAEKLYAVTLQFTNEIGKVGQTDAFVTRLADILSAHGVSPEGQADITRSLLAGRATELAKVLGKNITQIEKEAAAAGGFADFSKLDDATKKLLLFNEVMRLGEKDTGAANQRLLDADGILASVAARYDRARESAGRFLVEHTAVGTALKGYAIGGIPGIFDFAAIHKAEQEAQDAAIRQEAQRRSDEKLRDYQQGDLRAQLAKDPSRKFESADLFEASQQLSPETISNIRAQARQAGEIKREEGERITKEAADLAEKHAIEAGLAAGKDFEAITHDVNVARTKAIIEFKQLGEDLAREEETVTERRLRLAATHTLAENQREAFITQYESLFKDKRTDIVVAQFAERQFNEIKGIFDPAKAKEIQEGLSNIFKGFQQEAGRYLKGVRDAAEGLFSNLADKYAGEGSNPFVKILSEAEERAKKLEKQFGVLGDKTVEELKKIEAEHTRQQVLATQLDADLEAASLRREAAHIREEASIKELTRLDKARLEVMTAQLEAALKIPEYEAKALALRQGKVGADGKGLGVNQDQVLSEQYRNLVEQFNRARELTGQVGQKAQEQAAKALTDFYEGLDGKIQARIARGQAPGRDVFAQAYDIDARAQRQAEQEARAKEAREGREYARDQDLGRQRAELLRKAEAEGLSPAEVDRRTLAFKDSREIDPTGNLRAGAAEREADRQTNLQKTARDAVEKATEKTEELTSAVDNLARAMQDPENRRLLIEIINRSKADVKDDLYGGTGASLPPASPRTRK
jgi:hypothetical protein